jgi:hypothetical protein
VNPVRRYAFILAAALLAQTVSAQELLPGAYLVKLTPVTDAECFDVISYGHNLRFSVNDLGDFAKRITAARELLKHVQGSAVKGECISVEDVGSPQRSFALGLLLSVGKARVERISDKHIVSAIQVQQIHAFGAAGGGRFFSYPDRHLILAYPQF